MHLGQLKRFIRSSGIDASAAMRFALEHWSTFTLKVAEAGVLPNTPHRPDISFMCLHSELLLVSMMEKHSPSATPKQVPISNSKHKISSKEVLPKVTKEEVEATLVMLAEFVANNKNT